MGASRVGQLELFADEEEQYIEQEVARKLWSPLLPNAGEEEWGILQRLRVRSRDDSLLPI